MAGIECLQVAENEGDILILPSQRAIDCIEDWPYLKKIRTLDRIAFFKLFLFLNYLNPIPVAQVPYRHYTV
jgi:hypothetical protein